VARCLAKKYCFASYFADFLDRGDATASKHQLRLAKNRHFFVSDATNQRITKHHERITTSYCSLVFKEFDWLGGMLSGKKWTFFVSDATISPVTTE
jgi:hypothetical protein